MQRVLLALAFTVGTVTAGVTTAAVSASSGGGDLEMWERSGVRRR